MEGINSFEKGLHRTNSPSEQPEGSYVDALNWIRNDSGRLINEELEELVKSFNDRRILLGYCSIANKFICLFKISNFSEIGVFENKIYTREFIDSQYNFKLNFTNPIDCLARINSSDKTVLYFVEKDQKPRIYTLGTSTTINDIRDFDLQLEYLLAQTTQEITKQGSLKSGVYSVVARYRTAANNTTACNIPSRFVTITDDDIYNESFDGCPPGTPTNKGINIKFIRSDLNFPYVEPIIITYEGIANSLVCRSLGVYPNIAGLEIPFVSEAQYKDSVSTEEITLSPVIYSSATCIEQKDNVLVLSNLKGKTYDRNIQKIANNINVKQMDAFIATDKLERKDLAFVSIRSSDFFDSSVDTDVKSYNYRATVTVEDTSNNTDLKYSKGIFEDPSSLVPSGLKHYTKKSFKKGEVYSFCITPIYTDGTIGFSYHIPAKTPTVSPDPNSTRTEVYTSLETYPSYLSADGLTGGIRHHRISNTQNRNKKVFLSFGDINFSSVKDVQGYIIGYQQRNSDLNTSHIATGIGKPYIGTGSFYRNSLLTGSYSLQYTDTNVNSQMSYLPDHNSFMFYSPETERGLEIKTNYKSRILGYIENSIYDGTIYQHQLGVIYSSMGANPNLGLFFEDSGTTALGKDTTLPLTENIDVAINVPRNNTSSITVDTNYNITETSGYTHIRNPVGNSIFRVDGKKYMGTRTNSNQVDGKAKIRFLRGSGSGIQVDNYKVGAGPPAVFTMYNYIPYIDIIFDNKIQYGQLENAEYAPLEVTYNINQTTIVAEGDVYTQKYWFHIHDGIKDDFVGGPSAGYTGTSAKIHRGTLIAGIWLESKNNYNLRHSDTGAIPYFPKSKVLHNNAGTGVVDLVRATSSISTGYNQQYSAVNNIKLTFPKPMLFEEVVNFTNRSIYSSQIFEGEIVDKWRVFPTNQYHDIPKNRGEITDTFVFNNNFFHHTEYGLWQSFFNPNTTQSTSQGEITLGNAGIFKLPSKLVLDIKGGYMGTKDKSGTNTPFGRVFLDHYQGKVFLFNEEGPVEISDLGLFSYFREFVNTVDNYSMGYDWANKRLLITKFEKETNYIYTNDAPVEILSGAGQWDTRRTAFDVGIVNSDKHYKMVSTLNSGRNNGIDYFKIEITERKVIRFLLRSNSPSYTGGNYHFGIVNRVAPPPPAQFPSWTIYNSFALYPAITPFIRDKQTELTLDPGSYWIQFIHADNATASYGLGDWEFYITLNKENIKKSTISFYPKNQTWTSLHSFSPNAYLTLNGASYAWQDGDSSFYNLDNSTGVRKEAHVTFVENTQPDAFKRFDRIEMNTMSGGVKGIFEPGSVLDTSSYEFKNQSFTHIHTWTDRQNSTELAFDYPQDYDTAFNSSYNFNLVPVNYYRSSFHAELPLDAVIDPYYNIFGDSTRPNNNLDINADFRTHMKAKFLYTKLSYKDNKPLVLNYVKTFFKPTVA